ncbi:MAG: TspO/MBR family protein [Bauldia litoralis]
MPASASSPDSHPPSTGLAAQVLALVLFLLLCYGAAFLGQQATAPNIPTWYAGLEKPWFNPPNAVFPIAWGILYTLMAVAAWLVWRRPASDRRMKALVAFGVQLVLNVAWSWAFFGLQNPLLGLVVIVPLLLAIAWMLSTFRSVSPLAALLTVPYLAWVAFATLLNAAIFFLN